MTDLLLANPELETKTVNDAVICIRNLNYYFGRGEIRKQILFDINLDLYPGQTVVLTGPSGSGKTTLLTLIGALRSAREGSLKVLDRELVGLSELELVQVRRNIGFIFQAHNLFDSLTAGQNVELAIELGDKAKRNQRKYKQKKREIAVKILTKLGLGHRIDYKPNALSGGQKQRVSVARALVNQPSLILADEPTAALDRSSSLEVLSMMQNLVKERGGTLLLVTHDSRVLELADTVISLDDGRLSQAKGELLRSISSLVSSILEMETSEIAETVEPLSLEQFSKFLDKLNNEFSQLLTTMNLLESRSLGSKLELIIQTLSFKIAQILNVVQVLNKNGDLPFDGEDEKRFFDLVQSLGLVLQSSILYAQQGHSTITQSLKSNPDELKQKVEALSVEGFLQFLEKLNQELVTIHQDEFIVQDALLKSKLENLRTAIALKMTQVLQAETITLFIINRDKQTLRADHALGQNGKRIKIKIPLETGIVGDVARTGEPAIANDPDSHPHFNADVDRATGFKTRNLIALPLIDPQSQEVIAVVQAINKLNNADFDTEDRDQFFAIMKTLETVLPYSIDTIGKSFTYD